MDAPHLVVALDGLVLKIFPPILRAQFISERASLSQLRGLGCLAGDRRRIVISDLDALNRYAAL